MARIYDRVANGREAGALTDPVRYDLYRPTGSATERKSLEDWLADFSAQLGTIAGASTDIILRLETTASIATTTIGTQVKQVTTLGYAAAGDGGGATFKIVGSAPAHPGYRTSANGKICEIIGSQIDLRALGGVPGGGASTSKQAYLDWIATGVATKIPLYIPPYTFDLGDAYITVSGPVNIRGEGKQSNLKRSVRSGSTSFGILLWITTSQDVVLEQFQIEYAAGTWPAHPGGIPDADAGVNCAIILTNCDGPVVNEVHILGTSIAGSISAPGRKTLQAIESTSRLLMALPVSDHRAPTTASILTATPEPPSQIATSFSLKLMAAFRTPLVFPPTPSSAASSAALFTTASSEH
jgi:hypothetical protein